MDLSYCESLWPVLISVTELIRFTDLVLKDGKHIPCPKITIYPGSLEVTR